jgi:chorismate mutase
VVPDPRRRRIRRRCVVAAVLLVTAAPADAVVARADPPGALFALVDAAAQRLQTADPVAASKWVTNTAVDDPARVRQVVAAVTSAATANHIDPGYVRQVFNDQINATDAIEYSRFAQWKLDPGHAPTAAPDLSASRSVIDGLNRQMVNQLASHWELLRSPTCTDELDDATKAVTDTRQLDDLYQRALSFATRSYCRS